MFRKKSRFLFIIICSLHCLIYYAIFKFKKAHISSFIGPFPPANFIESKWWTNRFNLDAMMRSCLRVYFEQNVTDIDECITHFPSFWLIFLAMILTGPLDVSRKKPIAVIRKQYVKNFWSLTQTTRDFYFSYFVAIIREKVIAIIYVIAHNYE